MLRRLLSWLSFPGLFAAALALVAQRLLHVAFPNAPFAPYSMAEWIVRTTPGPLATYAIEHLGHRALPSIGYGAIALTLVIGLVAGKRPPWALASIAFLLTLLAGRLDPLGPDGPGILGSAFLAAVVAFAVAIGLRSSEEAAGQEEPDWTRRRLLIAGALSVLLVGLVWTASLRRALRMVPVRVVRADQPATIPLDSSFVEAPGLSPRVTSRADHYLVDIDLEDPVVGEDGWRLQVTGRVQSPLSFSLSDLESAPTIERINNLSCISNEVGGHLIGNSRWTGVPLDHLLEMAAPLAGARTLLVRAIDGYAEAIALDDIRGRDALIAIAMNGQTLPSHHGFPARLLFPGHYGMRNVKWLTDLVLLDHDEEGYWAQRGWDKDAIVRTESRFDVPGDGSSVMPPFVCAGIAWAGTRGIQRVEVSADDGQSWQPAQLEGLLAPLSWRRWQLSLDLPLGAHALTVRATDGTGVPQDVEHRQPHPSGASGYHRIEVNVSAA